MKRVFVGKFLPLSWNAFIVTCSTPRFLLAEDIPPLSLTSLPKPVEVIRLLARGDASAGGGWNVVMLIRSDDARVAAEAVGQQKMLRVANDISTTMTVA